jgi:hypothetical protein
MKWVLLWSRNSGGGRRWPGPRRTSLEGRLINFGASWPDFCARRDDTLFTSDNVTSFGSGFGLAA